MNLKKTVLSKIVTVTLCALFGLFFAYLLFKLFFDILLPFTIAWFSALLFRPLIQKINKKTGISRRFLGAVAVIVLISAISLILFFAVTKMLSEAKVFFVTLYENAEPLIKKLLSFVEGIKEKFNSDSVNTEYIYMALTESLKGLASKLSESSAAFAARLVQRLPSILFSLFIFVISVFYICMDFDRISGYIMSLLPDKLKKQAARAKIYFFSGTKRYLKSYFIIFTMTFSELFIAFLILGVGSPTLLAFLTAALDILPAIGVGIVLIPWAISLYLLGNAKKALSLLIVYAVVTIVRQLAEPHIIGASFGIHPLLSLVSLFVGYKLFGIIGMLASPILALFLKKLPSLITQCSNQTAE